jgi:hypothetical protein
VGAFPEVYQKIKPERGVLMDRPEFETKPAGGTTNGGGANSKNKTL